MIEIELKKVEELLAKKYKAEKISKAKFKELLYGPTSNVGDNISDLTEGIIKSENALFYLINDVEILNENCKCIDKSMYPSGKVLPLPLSMFYPYILFVVGLSDDGKNVVNYAKWGSFSDNIFESLDELAKGCVAAKNK